MVAVAKAEAGVLRSEVVPGYGSVLKVVRKRIVGDLVVVLAQRGNETQLIGRVYVKNQGPETAVAIGGIVHHFRNRRLQAEIRAVPIHTGVVSETLRVTTEAELIVRLIEVAGTQNQLSLIVALEPGTRNDVEHAISPVAEFRAVAAAVDLHVVDVFRIKLRGYIRRNVRVGHRNAVHQPTGLVTSANVQLVMRDVRAGDEIRNHRHAIAAGCPRSALDVERSEESGGRSGIGGSHVRLARDSDVGVRSCDLQKKVNDRHGTRDDGDVL